MSKAFIIPSRFTVIDQFSPAVDKMSKNASASLDRMERKMRDVSSTAFDVSKKTALIGGAIIAPLGLAVNEAIKFEEKMSNVATLVDTNAESMEDMGNAVLSMSRKLPVAIDDLATSLYDIRSAGVPAAQSMSTLEMSSKLAVAGLATAAEGTNLMTSAVNAFASEELSAAEISDILFKTVKAGKTTVSQLTQGFGATAPIVQSAGVALSDFQAATAALTTVGTPASQAQNQIRAAVVAMQKPTADMAKIFKTLGVTSEKELISREGSLVGAFEAINKAGTDMGMNMSKAWSSVEASAAVTSLTGATNQAYVNTLEDMRHGVNAIDEAFDKQSKTGKAGMQMMKNNLQGLGITIGNALLPMVNDLLQTLTPLIERFADWMQRNRPLVVVIAKTAAVVGGLMLAISGVSAVVGVVSKGLSMASVAMKGFGIASKLAMNPVVAIGTAVALAATTFYGLYKESTRASASMRVQSSISERASNKILDQRVEIEGLFRSLKRLNPETQEYKDKLSELDRLSPGLVNKYKLQEGAIRSLEAAEKDLVSQMQRRAEIESAKELLSEVTKERMQLEQQAEAQKDQGAFSQFIQGFGDYDNTLDRVNERLADAKAKEAALLNRVASDEILSNITAQDRAQAASIFSSLGGVFRTTADVLNPESARQESITESKTTQEQTVKIEFTGLPEGMTASVAGGGSGMAIPVTTSTRK